MQNLLPNYIVSQVKKQVFEGSFSAVSLFADISGFTATTEELMKHGEEGAEILSDILKYLFDTPVAAVYGFGGFITRYAGDAFTALYEIHGDEVEVAERVLQTAIEIKRFFAANKLYQSKFGTFEFGVKIGLAMGNCHWGLAGAKSEKSYYFKGDAVDLCAEAEHNANKGEIWLSNKLFQLLEANILQSTKSVMHTRTYYQAVKLKLLNAKPSTVPPVVADKQTLYLLAGKKESEFPVGEFREIVSVFIAFQETRNLQSLMEIVYRLRDLYGGSHPVLDFGDKGGNILLFFGTPTAFENNNTRALNFVWQLKKECSDKFTFRAGLCQGIVYCGFNGAELHREFTCLGNTVNQSARFMMKAEWGEIWLDERLSASSGFNFHLLGDFEFKGRAGKISAYRLQGRIEDLEITFAGNFIDRKKELKAVVSRLKKLEKRGMSGVFYLDGEAGFGKSRLIYQTKKSFSINSTQWCYLPCDDIIKGSFNPLISYIKKMAAVSEENDNKNNCARFDSLLANLLSNQSLDKSSAAFLEYTDFIKNLIGLPVGDPEFHLLEAEERYTRTLAAIKAFFVLLMTDKNLILEFDNAQHLDQDTQNLIKYLLATGTKPVVTIILNCRLQDNGELFDFGLTEAENSRLLLKNLNREQVKSLIKERLGLKKIPLSTVDIIFEKSNGNPLFAEQIIRYLQDNKLFDNHFRISSSQEIPTGINQIVVSRIDKLKKYLRELVKTAAVVGHQFSAAILGKMLNEKYKNLQELLAEGENEDIWQAVSEINYLFKYAVVHDVVYDMQLKKTVKELHLLSAQTIEQNYADKIGQFYEVLAYHYDKAESAEKAMQYLKLAGLQCKENYQNKKAVEYLDRWVEYAEQLLFSTGINWNHFKLTLENRLLAKEYAEIGFHRFYIHGLIFNDQKSGEYIIENIGILAKLLNDDKIKIGYAIDFANFLITRNRYSQALTILDDILPVLIKSNELRQLSAVYYNLGIINWKTGKSIVAEQQFLKASEFTANMVESKSKQLMTAQIYGGLGVLYDYSGNLDKALFYYNKQLDINRSLKNNTEIAITVGNIGVIHHMRQNLDQARKCYLDKFELCQQLGARKELSLVLNNLGYLENDCQNLKKSVSYYKQSIKLSEDFGDYDLTANTICNLANVYKKMKKYDESEQLYIQAEKISSSIKKESLQSEVMVEFAELKWLKGDKNVALGLLEEGTKKALACGNQEIVDRAKMLQTILI